MRSMVEENPSLLQRHLGNAIVDGLKREESLQLILDIVRNVYENTEACGDTVPCFCQIMNIFAIAFVCGVKIANMREDIAELERMSR
jgi:hypothetical protein